MKAEAVFLVMQQELISYPTDVRSNLIHSHIQSNGRILADSTTEYVTIEFFVSSALNLLFLNKNTQHIL